MAVAHQRGSNRLPVLGGALFDLMVEFPYYLLHAMCLDLILGDCVGNVVKAVQFYLGRVVEIGEGGDLLFGEGGGLLGEGLLENGGFEVEDVLNEGRSTRCYAYFW